MISAICYTRSNSEFVEFATRNAIIGIFEYDTTCTPYSGKNASKERAVSKQPFQLEKCFVFKKIIYRKGLCVELHYIALCLLTAHSSVHVWI
jgi:hypothetical protein